MRYRIQFYMEFCRRDYDTHIYAGRKVAELEQPDVTDEEIIVKVLADGWLKDAFGIGSIKRYWMEQIKTNPAGDPIMGIMGLYYFDEYPRPDRLKELRARYPDLEIEEKPAA